MNSSVARLARHLRKRYAEFLTDAQTRHTRQKDVCVSARGIETRGTAYTGSASFDNAISLSTAYAAAKAIVEADARGLECVTEDETDFSWDGDGPAPEYFLYMWVRDPSNPRTAFALASMGGIGVNSLDDPYLDIVRGELFAEVLTEIHAREESAANAAASELASRATYAMGVAS